MTPNVVRGAVRAAVSAAALLAALAVPAAELRAQQATTTASVRGVVSGPDGQPVAAATVVAINEATGTRRGTQTDDRGRYQIPFLDPGNYTVRAQRIGFRPVERTRTPLRLGQVEVLDFSLQSAPTQLSAQVIVSEADPTIETTKTGTSTRITEDLIQNLPTNGRNFKDLVVLAPGTSDQGNLGSGGGQSIGGGRTGASNILMDGVNNNESFFGGDARGGDRAPFSYSIEAVKEIQVITAGYDVERGQYTGGTVNAVTKSGTNAFSGAVFGYFRGDEFAGFNTTARDFLGNAPVDFKNQQYGFSLGGPIVRDRAHFFFALDRSLRNEPLPVFSNLAATDAQLSNTRIHPDTLQSIVNTARSLYGYDLSGEYGRTTSNVDESAFFGRLDWQINESHKLTLRDNYTNTNLARDRVFVSQTSNDFISNSGENVDKANSFVASLASTFTQNLSNEFRVQYATEDKPRPSYPSGGYDVPLPQVIVQNIRSTLSTGAQTGTTEIRFGADPVLHSNLLDQTTLEIINNVRWTRGAHTFKLGGNFLNVDVLNRFWNNSLGTFTFNTYQEFLNGTPTSFTRLVPTDPAVGLPIAKYDVNELALYLQDEWQVNPKLFVTYGVRYDNSWFPANVAQNPLLQARFPYLDVTKTPEDNDNFSPRFGFTFDPGANGRQVIRGGTGIFYGRSPYVLYSNALVATGGGQLSLTCNQAGTVPSPNFAAYAESYGNIPAACVGSGATTLPAQQIVAFDPDYEQSWAWKSNIAYDREIFSGWRATLEGVYSTVRDNYLLQDDNLQTLPRFSIEGGIPVFVEASTVNTGNGAVSLVNSRKDNNFSNVLVNRSIGSTLSTQLIAQLHGRAGWGTMDVTYTFDRTRDNGSIPCCTVGTMFGDARAFGNVNNFDNQWGPAAFSRPHTIVVSPSFNLPWGFRGGVIYRGFSGTPFTPRYNFDINGDGQSNDRLYVPTREQLADTALYEFGLSGAANNPLVAGAERAQFEQLINRVECLNENRGRVIARNACRNPWSNVLDARLTKRINTLRGQSVELQADFFNVLNGLNDKWGRRLEVISGNEAVLIPRGFTNSAATSTQTARTRFRYEVNDNAFQKSPANNFRLAQFQMQLGARYNF